MKSRLVVVLVLVLCGFVLAEPVWNTSSNDDTYYFLEDSVGYHNFTSNLSDSSDLSFFSILNISWSQGILGPDHSDFYWLPWNDTAFSDSSTGVFKLNSSSDNETGSFDINVHAQGDESGASLIFNLVVNATNDIPAFVDLNLSYTFPQGDSGYYTINATDEEGHYPLLFNLTWIDNCTHALWVDRADGENCSIFNLTSATSTSVDFDFSPVKNDVGTYWANFTVMDFNGTCPHEFCDAASYEVNKSSLVYLLKFDVNSMLEINVSNCTGASIMEGDTFNCTINFTTRNNNSALNFSSYAFFTNNPTMGCDRDWFYADSSDTASYFSYSLPISATPGKSEVGNWTINFTVWDTGESDSEVGQINIFVNYSEASVSLLPISDVSVYENLNFEVNATDDDLLIRDFTVKEEILNFTSNVSWVIPGEANFTSGNNYALSEVFVNHTYALENLGVGNYSVLINVTDNASNVDSDVFIIEILNESAPIWNISLPEVVLLNLTEDSLFVYNVSYNVSDPEDDAISFYYENLTGDFCSLNSTNFDSGGMINFTPSDCSVGLYNISVIATDGKLNSSKVFSFNVSNVEDVPTILSFSGNNGTDSLIWEGRDFLAPEEVSVNFSLIIDDYDFLVSSGQEAYCDESLTINVTFMNSTGAYVDLFNFSFLESGNPSQQSVSYSANFVASVSDIDDYFVFVNVTDSFGNSVNRSWNLNISENLEPPILSNVDNVSLTIDDSLSFVLNATDDEDDYAFRDLNYSVVALNGGPSLTVNITSGLVYYDFESNESLSGVWSYNASVNDSHLMMDWQIFFVNVYGQPNLTSPGQNFSFNLTENVSSVLNFTLNHSIGDNLTVEFWMDNVSCPFQNNSNCSYGNFSFREVAYGYGNGNVFSWNFSPSFLDETYGLYKNLTMKVYPNSSELNSSQRDSLAVNFSFNLNVSHTNAPMRAVAPIGLLQSTYNNNIRVDLEGYFEDEDVSDSYWRQNISFSKSSGNSNIFLLHSSGWNIEILTNLDRVHSGFIDILGNDTYSFDTISDVEVKFTEPETVTTPSSGGSSGTSTRLMFYSLRIIVPKDVIISDDDYIEIPFSLQNSGSIDLRGIDLSSQVLYNNDYSDDVKIDLGETYVETLKAGEVREYTMKILADTDKSGKYKATIFANVSSPKFSDWGDFFIDLRKTNDSEAEELLVFTEKILAENPECLELTEVFRRAKELLEAGNREEGLRLAQEVSEACEDSISSNEQIRYKIEGFVEKNFYYISFLTLLVFFIGLIFYAYKRIKFNKSANEGYIR
jgi:hypothetical protein